MKVLEDVVQVEPRLNNARPYRSMIYETFFMRIYEFVDEFERCENSIFSSKLLNMLLFDHKIHLQKLADSGQNYFEKQHQMNIHL